MMRPILKGSTDQSVVIRIVDSTDGTPETGVVFNTAGINLWYRREGATLSSITEATLSALNDAHSDGGVLHIGDGYYRLDLPDAAVATGANGVMVGGTVTGMVVIGCYVPLWDVNPYDAVRMGMTAIPNVAQGNAGQLPTATSAGLVTLAGVTHTGAVIPTVSAVTGLTAANLDAAISTRATPAQVATELATYDGPTNAEMVARTLAAAAYATAAEQATADGKLDDILEDTAEIGAAGAGLTAINLPDQTMNITGNITGNLSGSVGSVTGAVGSVTGNVGGNVAGSVGSVTAEVTPTAASKTGYRLSATGVDDVLDEVVLGSFTMRQLMRGLAAANLGKLAGAATTTITLRSADDTKDVVVATVDADGNRSAVTLDLA